MMMSSCRTALSAPVTRTTSSRADSGGRRARSVTDSSSALSALVQAKYRVPRALCPEHNAAIGGCRVAVRRMTASISCRLSDDGRPRQTPALLSMNGRAPAPRRRRPWQSSPLGVVRCASARSVPAGGRPRLGRPLRASYVPALAVLRHPKSSLSPCAPAHVRRRRRRPGWSPWPRSASRPTNKRRSAVRCAL